MESLDRPCVNNAKKVYRRFHEIFSGEPWHA